MANQDKPKIVSRKRVARVERDRMLNRTLIISTGVIVAVVVGLISWALVRENLIYPRQVVAIVEGEEILGQDFQNRVRVNRQQLVNQYVEYVQTMQLFGGDPALQQQLSNQLLQLYFQLQPQSVGSSTINQLVDDQLVILEAQARGIQVSEEQVEKAVHEFLGYFPDGRPTPSLAPTLRPTSTLSATQYALVSPTPTRTPAPSATPTSSLPSATAPAPATPGVDDSDAGAEETVPTQAVLPTATLYTFEGYQQVLEEYLNEQQRLIGLNEEGLRELLRVNLYREALFEQVAGDLAPEQEQVWARHILLADEETADEVLLRLSRSEDWAHLAEEYSQDSSNNSNGGDLGWFAENLMVEPFSAAAFSMRIGEISDPVESSAGWHIIQVLGHEVRPLTSQEFTQLQQSTFQEFIDGLREKYEWEIFDTWMVMTPEDPEIPLEYQPGF